jgi:uncharacterized protein (TIGR02597 family)
MQRAYAPRGLRFLPKLTLAITAGMITAAATYATDVFTDPVGFITQTATPSGLAFWGLGLTQLPVQKGIVGTVSGTTITDSSGAWTNNQFNSGGVPYEIEITSGSNAGLIDEIVGTTAPNQVTTANNDSGLITAGQTYSIRPSWTLNTLFGTNDSAGLFGASTATAADNVQVWNPIAQSFVTYFYKTNTNGGGVGWRASNALSVNAGTNALFLDQGFVVNRKIATGTNVVVVGAVKLGQTIVPITQSGLTFAGNVYATSLSLGSSGLYTTNDATGLHGASTATAADNVQIWNPAGQSFATYFFKTNTNGGGVGWRASNALSVDASTNAIPLGGVAVVNRKIATPFNWTPQQPY